MAISTETYPRRGPGEYAGTLCEVNKCRQYSRFVITVLGDPGIVKHLCCSTHLAMSIRGLWALEDRSVIVQEVPGNWARGGADRAVVNGEVVFLHQEKR
jgi:hypothetical protein